MMELTKSQKEVLDKIKLFISKNGYAPTIRELCFITDKSSPATIHFHLKNLKEKGYIDFDYNKNRTVKIINDNKDKVINDLLKRISKLEYEAEKLNNIINNDDVYGYIKHLEDLITKKDNIINKLENYIRARADDNDTCSICSVMTDDLLNILKGSDKE